MFSIFLLLIGNPWHRRSLTGNGILWQSLISKRSMDRDNCRVLWKGTFEVSTSAPVNYVFLKEYFLPERTDTGIHLFSAFYCYARRFYNNLSTLNLTWSHSNQSVIVPSPLSRHKNAFYIMFTALPTCLSRQIFPGASAFAVQWTWPWVENKIQLSFVSLAYFLKKKHLIYI